MRKKRLKSTRKKKTIVFDTLAVIQNLYLFVVILLK